MPDRRSNPVELSRCVRFCINAAVPLCEAESRQRHNTFAAWPIMTGLGAYYELEVRCCGVADPITGYLVNISAIDEAVRKTAIPIIHRAAAENPLAEPTHVLQLIVASLANEFGGMLDSVRWRLTPYHSVTMNASQTDRVVIAQQFEFAAAHRLHSEALSAEENRAVFGRCNNPHAHGHNYRVEVAVESKTDRHGVTVTLAELERIVDERIIRRFDHTNLNVDVSEFASLNPSVENIVKVCHELIRGPIEEAGARLSLVTVWETEKTSCTYRG